MKYHEGNIVLLKNGKTVYIVSVDEDEQKYLVVDAESAEPNAKAQYIKEANIQILVTQGREEKRKNAAPKCYPNTVCGASP